MELLLYIFCLFPFVKWLQIDFGTDTQPYALVWSVLCIGVIWMRKTHARLMQQFIYLILSVLAGVACVIVTEPILPEASLNIGGSPYTVVRNLLGIASMLCISYAAYLTVMQKGLNEKYIKIIINVWLLVGLIQKAVGWRFGYNWVAGMRTGSNRGVTSLAAEPSFYGYMCLLLLLFVYDFKKHRALYALSLLFQLVCLAESSNGLLLAGICSFFLICHILAVSRHKLRWLLAIALSGILCIPFLRFLANQYAGHRLGTFAGILISDKSFQEKYLRYMSDGSIAQRARMVTLPLQESVGDFLLPHGLYTSRNVSGFTGLIYVYGVVGVVMIILIFRLVRRAYDKRELGAAFAFALTAVMIIGIQLTNPTIWFYLGYCMARTRRIIYAGGYYGGSWRFEPGKGNGKAFVRKI